MSFSMKAEKGVEPVPLFVGWAVAPNPVVDAPKALAGCVVVELPNPPPKPVVAGLAAPNKLLPPALPEPNPVLEVAPPKGDDVAAVLPKVPDEAPPPKIPPPVAGAGAPKAGLFAAPKGVEVAVALLEAPKPSKHI